MDDQRGQASQSRPRKPYLPPTLDKFALRPEEAVLGGCKGPTQSGSMNPNRCRNAIGNPCTSPGS